MFGLYTIHETLLHFNIITIKCFFSEVQEETTVNQCNLQTISPVDMFQDYIIDFSNKNIKNQCNHKSDINTGYLN